MNSVCSRMRELLVGLLIASIALAPTLAHAQEMPNERRDKEEKASSPSVTMPVVAPNDTEVMQPERNAISQPQTPTFPLEEPLNADTYICGRGDVFELNFYGRQNFRMRFAIDIEGHTFISRVGHVDVTGKTLTQARAIVNKAVSRIYPGLTFELSLVVPRTFLVHVVQFVAKPGIYHATPIERVSSVLAAAGGSNGSIRRIEIKHRDGTLIYADLLKFEQTGDSVFNPFVQDGDIVRVPFAETTVTLQGAVQRPGHFELIGNRDLAELMSLSGGLRSTATHRLPLRVRHRAQDETDVMTSYAWPADGSLPKIGLTDGDVVLVPSTDELQRSVLLIGPAPGAVAADEVTSLRRLPYYEGATARSLIESNGSLGASADLKNAYIKHGDGKIIPLDLDALLVRRDFRADVAVQIDDTIVVPQRRYAVLVEGAVARPGVYPFNPRFGGDEYITIAGGPTKMAKGSDSYRLVKPTGQEAKLSSQVVTPGDTLVVPERGFSRTEVVQLVFGTAGLVLSVAALGVLVFR